MQRAAFRDIFDFANTLEELTEDKTSGLEQAGRMAEQLRDQQIQQQYSDQLVVYVQEKAEQIDRLQSSLAAVLTSEQAQLQAIQQRPPGWTAAKKRARSMGAAGCATKYQDRADCVYAETTAPHDSRRYHRFIRNFPFVSFNCAP